MRTRTNGLILLFVLVSGIGCMALRNCLVETYGANPTTQPAQEGANKAVRGPESDDHEDPASDVDGLLAGVLTAVGLGPAGWLIGRIRPMRVIKNLVAGQQASRKYVKETAGKRVADPLGELDALVRGIHTAATEKAVKRIKKKAKIASVKKA